MTGETQYRHFSLTTLCWIALAVGTITGLGAVVFRMLVAGIHNLFFLGEFSWFYDANEFTPAGIWGPFVILAPVIGGMGVVYLVKNYAPEARGHGVPEVINAVFHENGNIRPRVAIIKILASALSIGSGAAVGREGPIVQIGSTLGSSIGQFTKLVPWQKITLLAAGAGAGIAATFNTPLGAAMFAVELLLPEISARTFLPVVIATGASTYVGRLFFGMQPAFIAPVMRVKEIAVSDFLMFWVFVALGVLCGVGSWLFMRMVYLTEDAFKRIPVNDYVRHALGMLWVGIVMYWFFQNHGHYYVEGVGYAGIQFILRGGLWSWGFLALLFFAKLMATSVSIGSGASGGIFSPSLFLGATLGASFGALLAQLWPAAGFDPVVFAMVGMAGVVGGGTGAAMTAIIMIFEMTLDYNIIVPVIVAVAVALGVRRFLSEENIYTLKLSRRGRRIPKERHVNMFLVRHARQIMLDSPLILPFDMQLGEAIERLGERAGDGYIVVTRGRHIVGIVHLGGVLRGHGLAKDKVTLGELASKEFVLVNEEDIVNDVLERMGRQDADFALVLKARRVPRPDDVAGLIAKEHIADPVLEGVCSLSESCIEVRARKARQRKAAVE